jgi:hypothetical protein
MNGMVIRDSDQEEAVNLANVDSIKADEEGELFVIYFRKLLMGNKYAEPRIITRWDYNTKDERDHCLNQIIAKYGSYIDGGATIPII